MLLKGKSYFVLSINKYLEVAVFEGSIGNYSLPRYTNEQCGNVSVGKFKFISDFNIEFFYCEQFTDSTNVSWICIDKVQDGFTDERQKNILKYFIRHNCEIVSKMEILDSICFVNALQNGDLGQVRKIPKSDLHNHIPLGGSRTFLRKLTGYSVPMLTEKFTSILEMNAWCKKNIKGNLNVPNEFVARTLAAFLQAEYDGVKVFAPNFALCARKDFDSYDELLSFITSLVERFSDSMEVYPELCLDRHKVDYEREKEAITLLRTGIFYSLDVTGDELLGIDNFVKVYQEATQLGIIRKAHVGEFSPAKYIADAIYKLDLNMIQHGLSSVEDEAVVDLIKERKISLTICPTSNYYLSRVDTLSNHPISKFVYANIPVSICSDDILIFDSCVSGEYLKLYKNGVLSEFELNKIRIFGLEFYQN